MAKAFDSVAWPFLFEIMRHRGFGPRSLARVALVLSTASSQVLVNGEAGANFWHAKGFAARPPMFFIMVADVLNAVFRVAEEAGVFTPLTNCGNTTSSIPLRG